MSITSREILMRLKMVSDISDVANNVKEVQRVINGIDAPKDLKQKFTGIFSDLERETKNYQKLLDSGFKGKKDVTGLEASGKRINSLMKSLQSTMKGIRTEDLERSFRVDPTAIEKINKELKEAKANLANITASSDFQDFINQAEGAAAAMQKVSKTKFTGEFMESLKKGDIEGAANAIKNLEANHKTLTGTLKDGTDKEKAYNAALDAMKATLSGMQNISGLQDIITKIETLKTNLTNINSSELEKLIQNFSLGREAIGEMTNQTRGLTQAQADAAAGQQRLNSDLEQLKSRIGYFFSLTNSVQLFRRAVNSAMDTVKELDKTMTEAAVVTDFSVGDMWKKLPQYSKAAQDLGVSINGMYQATTLYYQQGLKTNAAMSLGVETMKMAKIAGIDSTEATKAMTAALRGFNMELNETSATKVNDVYSQLAAVTAADTSQIATAMEKTASIAAAANMEFETTAALLAQIIETTQEAPETAGTALKTIIARFSEVKSLREQGQTSGQDSEGEAIDVNKIQTALRSVGISMEGFFAGTEGLDDVLLKLAEKWSGLDFETQRYIATMAAGSRQQSRFIAMMSDYSRTTELVTEAQNSAGASSRQFSKTLESMESKLQRLKNAWDQFAMGLANNEILKGAVDILTEMIEGVNKLTNALSAGNGLVKSVLNLGVALGGLTMGKQVVNGLFGAKLGKTGVGQLFGFGAKGEGQQKSQNFVTPGGEIAFGDIVKSGWNKTKQQGLSTGSKIKGFVQNPGQIFKSSFGKIKNFGLKQGQKVNKNNSNFAKLRANAEGAFDPKDSTAKAAGVRKLNEQLAEGNITVKEAAEGYEKLGYNLKEAGVDINKLDNDQKGLISSNQQFVQGTEKVATGLSKMSNGMFIAGAACAGLSALLSAMGYDEAAEEMSKLSGIIMGLGAVFMILPPIVTGVGKIVAAAGITASAAWIWIFGIGAAAAVLIGVLVALSNKEKTLEKDIESTNKQIDQMNTATKEAGEALEHITDTRQDLVDMQNAFSGLAKGTTEWKKALVESNAKVLEMLELYPQLVEYIDNEDGLLKIRTEGWEKILEEQANAMTKTQAISTALQIKKAGLEKQQYALKASANGYSSTEIAARNTSYDVQAELLLDSFFSAAARSSEFLNNSDYTASAIASVGLGGSTDMITKLAEKENVDASKGAEDELIREYAALIGKEESVVKQQLENGDLTKEEMAEQIKIGRATEKMVSQMEKTAKAISKIGNEKDKDLVSKMLSEEGRKLRRSDVDDIIEAVGGDLTTESLAEYFSGLGITLDDTQIADLLNNIKQVQDNYDKNFGERLQKMGFSDSSKTTALVQKSEYGVASDLVDKIATMYTKGSSTAEIEGLMSQIEQYVAILGDEAMAMFAEGNWKSLEQIDSVFDYLKGLEGADIEELDLLSDRIAELNNAVTENTTAQLQEKGYFLSDVLKELKSGEMDRYVVTEEQKKKLIEAKVGFEDKQFTPIGTDSYQYDGDLYAKTVELIADKVEGINTNLTTAQEKLEKGKEYKDEGFSKDVAYIESLDYKEQRVATNEEIQKMYWGEEDYGLDNKILKNVEQAYRGWGTFTDLEKQAFGNSIANYYKQLFGEDIIIGEDANVLAEKAKQINGLYTEMATFLNEPIEENLTTEQKLAKIKEWEDTWGNLDALTNDLNNEIVLNAGSVQSDIDKTTSDIGWEVIRDADGNIDRAKQKEYNAKRSDALEQRLLSTGGSVFVKDIEKAIADAGGNVEEFRDAINGLASDMAVTSSRVKDLATNLEELKDDLNPDNRGTTEYGKALEAAKLNVAELFQVNTKDLDTAGIADSVYEALAAGNPQALTQISNLLRDSLLQGVDLANAMSYISPTMDENAIEALYYALGGVEGTFNENMSDSLDFIENRLLVMGYNFAGQISATGAVSGVTSKLNLSNMYGKYYKPSGGGSSNKWTNEYDEFYNMVQKINEELRTREKLELRYQRLISRNAASAKKLAEAVNQQLESYKTERLDRTSLLNARKAQMDSILEQYSDVGKYATYSHESGLIQIDWSALEALEGSTNEKLTSRIEDYISKLEEQKDLIQEEEDALDSIEDGVWEIFDQGKDEYFDFEDRVKEALIEERQREIDKLSEINQSINDTNTKVLESMQSQLEETRQIRDNQKKEKEIADKQRKLAYLQQDTSGANAKEIRELQKEINEAQESYTDKLIDQKISELQKQNEEAAEQRQQQIDIAQAQLDQWKDSADIWNAVHELIGQSVDIEGNLMEGSKLENLLKEIEGFEGMSTLKKMDWLNTLETTVATSLAWLESGAMQSLYGMGSKVTFTDASGKEVVGTVNKDGDVITDDGRAYSAGSFKIDANTGKIRSTDTYDQAVEYGKVASKVTEETPPVTNVYNTYDNGGGGGYIPTPPPEEPEEPETLAITPLNWNASNKDGSTKGYYAFTGNGATVKTDINGIKYVEIRTPENGPTGRWMKYDSVGKYTYASWQEGNVYRHKLKGNIPTYSIPSSGKWIPAYKTGGLADFTGPAWLDGTKSRPEYILNADQTKAFFTLVDVLGSLQTKDSKASQNSGDNTYDIDINVESIGSDYDVEQLANTVKRLINEDARYRNNNTINLMR